MSFKKTLSALAAGFLVTFGSQAKAGILDRTINWLKGNPNYLNMAYQEARRQVQTPEQAGSYCNLLDYKSDYRQYNLDDFWASLKLTHLNQAGDCDDFAVAAAGLLSDDGFAPNILGMRNKKEAHAVFVYQDGGYGSIGRGNDTQSPRFDSVNQLVHKLGYSEFGIFRLGGDVVSSEHDLKPNSGLSYQQVYGSAFKPDLRRSLKSAERTSFPDSKLPLHLPKTAPRTNLPEPTPKYISPITPALTPQQQFEMDKRKKLASLDQQKREMLELISNGKYEEANSLASKLEGEVQEARRREY